MENDNKRRDSYLEQADEAERLARSAHGETKEALLKIAQSWRTLAEQIGGVRPTEQ